MAARATACASPCRSDPAGRSVVQRKARLGALADPLEHAADTAAERVLAGRRADVAKQSASVRPTVQRWATGPAVQGGAESAARAVSAQSGAPLSVEQRAYFEPRFGRDLSSVRLHTGGAAARAADGIAARAYAVGQDIGFAPGEYSPETPQGRRLLAHELAHTLQQSDGVVRRQPALPDRTFEDESGGGRTSYREAVLSKTNEADGTISGQVRREIIAPAVGAAKAERIHWANVNVIFDPKSCAIRLPFVVDFVAADAAQPPFCAEPAANVPVPRVFAARVAEIGGAVVSQLQEGLNGWFKLRVEGCEHSCAGRDIPIRVDVSQSKSKPDLTIDVVNRGGRANAAAICAGNFHPRTTVHEGGHQRLGTGDEYREENAAARAAHPNWARDERVRRDFSYMNDQYTAGRFSTFHERHFRFAQVFLEAALANPACKVSLVRERSLPSEKRVSLSFGGYGGSGAGGGGPYLTLGYDAAKPLTATRRLAFERGLRAQWLNTPGDKRDALMFGVRLGVTAQTYPAEWGPSIGLFAQGGATVLPSLGGFGEVGGKIGVTSPMDNAKRLGLELEGALGRTFGNDAENKRYARVGLNLVFSL